MNRYDRPLVSVIVPIYNSEKTLIRCVNSIQRQTWRNLEIFLINDGSSDRSAEICRELAQSDKRIIFINQKNSGVSATRNVGLDKMSGKYCCFLDADDWIDADHITALVEAICDTECVVEGYIKESEQNKIPCMLKRGRYNLRNLENTGISDLFVNGYIHPCWNKLFIVDLIRQNNIRFDTKIHISEDSIFCMNYLIHCNDLRVLDKTSYHYCFIDEKESLSKKLYPESLDIYEEVFSMLDKLFERGNMTSELKKRILVQTIFPQLYSVIIKAVCSEKLAEEQRKNMFDQISNREYCRYVMFEELNTTTSFVEKICTRLILLKKYKLFSVVMKWLIKR